jgi:hypothetical protein
MFFNPANPGAASGQNLELAAHALVSLIDTTELFPLVIRVDLYGGIYSVYESGFREKLNTNAN